MSFYICFYFHCFVPFTGLVNFPFKVQFLLGCKPLNYGARKETSQRKKKVKCGFNYLVRTSFSRVHDFTHHMRIWTVIINGRPFAFSSSLHFVKDEQIPPKCS